jgi:hypothetical protein
MKRTLSAADADELPVVSTNGCASAGTRTMAAQGVHDCPVRSASRTCMRPMGFLRTAELNWVGWSALVASSCTVGAAGAALAAFADWPWLPVATAGVLLVPACLIVLDRCTWRNGYTYMTPSGDADAAGLTAIAQNLRDLGYDVTMDHATQDTPTLVVRNRDLERVHKHVR